MMPQLLGINPVVRNAKYLSSTEKYVQQEMGGLTDQLAKYHPFG